LDISVHLTGEQSGFLALFNQALERATRFYDLRRKLVHLEVALIEQSDAPLRVKHVQTLRHVVERGGEATILLLQTAVEDADDGEG